MSDGVQTMDCRIVTSIREVPDGLWDERVAQGHPFKSAAFLGCLEAAFPERRFCYFLFYRQERLIGLTVATEEDFDVAMLLPAAIGRWCARVRRLAPGFLKLRIAQVGTLETAGPHWWLDRSHISAAVFAERLVDACTRAFPSSRLLLVRDFMETGETGETGENREADRELLASLVAQQFRSVLNLPLATVVTGGLTIDDYSRRLKSRSRSAIRKELEAAARTGLTLQRVHDFHGIIDECYPLYLQVHERASEFKRPPIPRAFFEELARQMPEQTSLLTARDQDGRMVGFVLSGTSDSIHDPFLIGMDYARTREASIYYNLLWREIEYACQRGCRLIDMGLTGYFTKQTLGASLEGMSMAARLQSRWLRPVLGPLLPGLLGAKQPRRRRTQRLPGRYPPGTIAERSS